LVSKLEKDSEAIVIGGGLIGISVTEALMKRGAKVTLVELQPKILSLILDPKASDIVENLIKKAGVQIVTGQSVQRIVGKSSSDAVVGGVVLTSGEKIQCDLVIIAIGVVPRTELAMGTALKTNKGILVDKYMRTNVADVYAAGDVAEAFDFVLNENRLLPLWPLAVLEGKVAGSNMAGKKTEYSGGTAMSALKYFGIPIISVGLANPKADSNYEMLIKLEAEKNIYKKLVLKDNVIVGITLLNDIERAGIFFNLLRNGVNVKKFKQDLLEADFGLASLPLTLRKKLYVGISE
jgi:NAD(P)H-nitrite reductase large subunit